MTSTRFIHFYLIDAVNGLFLSKNCDKFCPNSTDSLAVDNTAFFVFFVCFSLDGRAIRLFVLHAAVDFLYILLKE